VLQVVVVDEADECWQAQRAALEVVLGAAQQQQENPSMIFSGATLNNDLVGELKEKGWLPYVTAIDGPAEAPLPPGLTHRCVSKKCLKSFRERHHAEHTCHRTEHKLNVVSRERQ
jgi:hypothetical protein